MPPFNWSFYAIIIIIGTFSTEKIYNFACYLSDVGKEAPSRNSNGYIAVKIQSTLRGDIFYNERK